MYNLSGSQSDRINFDQMIERMIFEDEEIAEYSVEQYAADMISIFDFDDVVDDREEAEARIKSVVAQTLPQEQADRAETEREQAEEVSE
jgi:hypothetical protein